jgi:hypothetical protein
VAPSSSPARAARRLLAIALAGALLAGCATVEAQVVMPREDMDMMSREVAFETEVTLDMLREQDGRVAAIAYRLNTANADLCPRTGPLTGMVLHDGLQYGVGIRPYAMGYFGLGGYPGILGVVPGGPADRAGLKAGDSLVAINGQALPERVPPANDSRAPAYGDLQKAQQALTEALAKGPAELTIRRGGRDMPVRLTPTTGCAYEFQLIPSKELTASANGSIVFITTAMVRYAASDDDLAVVMGHEMAHNVMRHQSRIASGGLAGKLLGNLGTTPEALQTIEREADYVGLYLMARAGYDVRGAQRFWRRFGADYADARNAGWAHPGSLQRSTVLGAAAAEIEGKRARGEPLVPKTAPE